LKVFTSAVRVRGKLDEDALEQALAQVVAGNPRLSLALEPSTATVGLGQRGEPPRLRFVDANKRRSSMRDLLDELARHEARAAGGPGMSACARLTLVALGPWDHVILAVVPDVIADRSSTRRLLGHLARAYSTLARGGDAPPREDGVASPLRCADGQTTDRAHRRSSAASCDAPRAEESNAATPPPEWGLRRWRDLSPGIAASVDHLVTTTAGSVAAIMAASIQVFITRWTGQPAPVMAIADAGRLPDSPIGPHEAMRLVRTDLSDNPTFEALVNRVSSSPAPGGRDGHLLGQADAVHDVRALPDVEMTVDLADPFAAPIRAGGTVWEREELGVSHADADLSVDIVPNQVGLRISVEGARDRLDHDALGGVLDSLEGLIEAAAADPARRISELPLLPRRRRRVMLTQWNRTERPYASDRCLHELIEEQVRRTPEAVALTAGLRSMTYRELSARSNRSAGHLHKLGIGSEDRVAVVADGSPDAVVALLSVLKAGAAYVPLDPDLPPERLRFLLDDADPKAVMAGPGAVPELRFGRRPLIRCGGRHHDAGADLKVVTGPLNAAYVIYTSGSTGRPKGVVVCHQQIVNATAARWGFGRAEPEVYLLVVPLTFDAAAQGLFWTLCRGGRLVLAGKNQVRDPRLLARVIEAEGVTHLNWVPSLYGVLLRAGGASLRTLRDVSVGGETPSPQLVADHMDLLPATALYNDYGPTETTVWSAAHRCSRRSCNARVPIGRPIQNTRLYILDEHLNPVPVGIPGELYIGGDGVARGYHRQPRLTAERFVPDPFTSRPGDRLYRTGDLVRYRRGGAVEFLGRTDLQVKVRGHRIELGEVETALSSHPDVRAAVVVLHRDPEGASDLVGCFVANDGRPPAQAELAAFLRARLPAYMIPSRFLRVDTLPRTSHGKVDRLTLAQLIETTAHEQAGDHRRTRTIGDLPSAHVDDLLLDVLVEDGSPRGLFLPPSGTEAG
jgi:amino acid adenylation domain-containing protein